MAILLGRKNSEGWRGAKFEWRFQRKAGNMEDGTLVFCHSDGAESRNGGDIVNYIGVSNF